MKSYQVCECGAPLQLREEQTPQPVGTEVLAASYRGRHLPQRYSLLGR